MLQSQSSGEIFQKIQDHYFNSHINICTEQEIVVVSLNGYIHCWNALRMKQVCNAPDSHCDFHEDVKLASEKTGQFRRFLLKAGTRFDEKLGLSSFLKIFKLPFRIESLNDFDSRFEMEA